MGYKEKYEQALERAKKLYEQGTITESLGYVFPELQETADERIRKGLIKAVSGTLRGNTLYGTDVTREEALAWLEKQGEKPTGKVEPKFKVGDWIVQENIGIYKVIEVCESWYEVVDNKDEHYSISFDKEYMCRLWTINDAKEGDVLIKEETGELFIHNGNRGTYLPEFLGAYCGIDNGEFKPNGSPYYWGIPTCPATKKQRDLLFSKMKEAGYEWDSEKKELKKIEPKALDADKVIEWLKNTIKERAENYGVYKATRLILPYSSIEDLINDFKEDFGLC